jgi:hypothetical protein
VPFTVPPVTLSPAFFSTGSVNIFNWRVTSERQPRRRIGQPAHSTTGDERVN